jgi:hypothetical protein
MQVLKKAQNIVPPIDSQSPYEETIESIKRIFGFLRDVFESLQQHTMCSASATFGIAASP